MRLEFGRMTGSIAAFAAAGSAFILYLFCLPHTVQTLDTGELVSHSLSLHLIHPPGYPFYQFLMHGWLSLFPPGMVFWGASLLTAIVAVSVLVLAGAHFRDKPGLGCILILPLATQPLFWRYSVLPDVFMLHLLVVTAVLVIYGSGLSPERRLVLISVVMAAGIANHHTIIFMAPFWIAALLQCGGIKWRAVSIVLGAVLTFAIYSLLRLLDFTALSGWREIRSLGDQMGHFLRSDYGTFKLRSGSGETWNILLYVRMLVHESVTANPLALAGLVLAPPFIAWRKVKEGALAGQEKAFFLLTVSVWIYMAVFFTLSNNEETAFTETVLERFLLFPALAGTIMSGYILAWAWHLFSDALRVLLPVLALALAALNASNNFNALNFRTNTAVEDNAIGILNLLPFDKPVVVLANGDTVYNSLVYAQEVLGVRRDAVVLPIGRLFDRDLLSRAQKKVNLIVDKSVFKQDVKGVARDLIRPNISAVNFFMTEPAVWKDIRTVYRPLGALLTAGSGVVVDTTGENLVPNRSSISQMAAINGYNETQSIYSRRCMVNLMEAKLAENNSDAAKALDKALDKVPFCLPAIHHKCARIPSGGSRRECDEMLEKAMASYHNYW